MDENRFGIYRDEEQVGELACYPDSCDDEVQALAVAGYTLRQQGAEDVTVHVTADEGEATLHPLDAECSDEDHEACDISTAVAWVRDLADESGIDASEVRALLESGYRDREQVVEVLTAVRDRLPETATVAGEEIQPRMASEQAIALVRGEWSIDDGDTAAPTE